MISGEESLARRPRTPDPCVVRALQRSSSLNGNSVYIEHFPKPLLDDLLRNRWVPIVGAGLSRNARTHGGMEMPLWNDLGKVLADEVADYNFTNALDAISTYAHEHSRAKLAERLTDLLLVDRVQPSDVHRAFCSIPFDLVCTTNLEFLLESQYAALSRYCRPIVDEDQLSIATREAGVTLFKVHGDVHHPQRMVVTEDDYDNFLNAYPLVATFLANLLITRTAVLVGYSLDDPDFRQIWRVVTARLGQLRRPAYVVLVGGSMADVARYKRRNVNVINLPGTSATRGAVLAKAFEELAEYWRKNLVRVSTVTAEEPLQQLALPTDATTRLCFFSIPLALNAFYKERVYPLVEAVGLVPVTADEVVTPGDNLLAKTDALLEHAEAIIVDTGSPWTWSEVGWLLHRALPKRVLVVLEEGTQFPSDLRGALIVRRPKVPIADATQ